MTEVVFKSFLAALGSGLLALIVYTVKAIAKTAKADDITMKALAHDAYFRQARYLLQKDSIAEAELENHNHLYEAYHAQGLNGTGDRLHDLVMEKPVEPHNGSIL